MGCAFRCRSGSGFQSTSFPVLHPSPLSPHLLLLLLRRPPCSSVLHPVHCNPTLNCCSHPQMECSLGRWRGRGLRGDADKPEPPKRGFFVGEEFAQGCPTLGHKDKS